MILRENVLLLVAMSFAWATGWWLAGGSAHKTSAEGSLLLSGEAPSSFFFLAGEVGDVSVRGSWRKPKYCVS